MISPSNKANGLKMLHNCDARTGYPLCSAIVFLAQILSEPFGETDMKRMILLLFLVPGIGHAQWNADEINYNWLRVGYLMSEFDAPGDNIDASGFAVDGSVAIRRHMHMFASYESVEFDDFPDVTMQERAVGIGAHFNLGDRISFFGQVGYLDVAVNETGFDADDDGAILSAGVRALLLPGWELRGGINHVELDAGGGETGVAAGSDLWLTDQFALSADVNIRDDDASIFLGGRIYFGTGAR